QGADHAESIWRLRSEVRHQRRWPDRGRVRRDAGPHHRCLPGCHHGPGHQRQRDLHNRQQQDCRLVIQGDDGASRCGASFVLDTKELNMLHRLSEQMVAFFSEEDGPTAVEYAVMLALIIVVCLLAITSIGTTRYATFTSLSSAVAAS